MKTLFEQHCERWKDGCGATECRSSSVVISRGDIPCQILFVGEAPGRSETDLNKPFVGPAGKLIDHIIQKAIPHQMVEHSDMIEMIPEISYAFTNLVGCIPLNEEGNKTAQPSIEQIWKCRPRLEEFIKYVACPSLIVRVGKLCEQWLAKGYKGAVDVGDVPMIDIAHPAWILRLSEAQQGLEVRRCVITIREAVKEFITEKE